MSWGGRRVRAKGKREGEGRRGGKCWKGWGGRGAG